MTKRYHHGDLPAALLQAAEAALDEAGLENFSLRAVAKRAGVSHAAPAHHFKDTQGLLTALAARGYRRFVKAQEARQSKADPSPIEQAVASGLGYIDFAEAHPALFRLMFSSQKPDRSDPGFAAAALEAYAKLEREAAALLPADAEASDRTTVVMASWSVVHGLAELIISGRAERPLALSLQSSQSRDAAIRAIILKVHGRSEP